MPVKESTIRRNAALVSCWKTYGDFSRVARRFGLSTATVKLILHENGAFREKRDERNAMILRRLAELTSAGTHPRDAVEEIAAEAGMSASSLRLFFYKRGVSLRGNKRKRNEERDNKIIADYLSGMSLRAAGEPHGLVAERVRRILMDNGVPRRPSPASPRPPEKESQPAS